MNISVVAATLDGRTIQNDGTIEWAGDGTAGGIDFTNQGKIQQNGIFKITGAGIYAMDGATGSLINNGLFEIPNNATARFGGLFPTSPAITVGSTGTFSLVGAASQLRLQTVSFNGGSKIIGPGSVSFGNLIVASGTTMIKNGVVTGGIVSGTGILSIMTGARLSGLTTINNAQVFIDSTGFLTISADLSLTNSGKIVNQGNTVWSGGTITVGANAMILNQNAGLFEIGGGGVDLSLAGAGSFSNNNGSRVRVFQGANTLTMGVTFSNTGDLELASGTMIAPANWTQAALGRIKFLLGNLRVAGTFTNNGTVQVTEPGTIATDQFMNNGAIDMADQGADTLTIARLPGAETGGNFTQGAGGSLTMEVTGDTTNDTLAIAGTCTFGGSLMVRLRNGYQPGGADPRTWHLINYENLVGGGFASIVLPDDFNNYTYGDNDFVVTVNKVNSPPAGADKTININEDAVYTFTGSDFGFSDTSDSPANNFSSVKITTLPGAGTLTNNNVAVAAGDFVTLADIGTGKLKFTPAANANGTAYTTFTFQVKDDGGTANGGVDLDPTANTITVNVTAVNDAPVNTVPAAQTINEDAALVFSTGNGNLISIGDADAGSSSEQITLTATGGTLTLSGTSGLTFSAGDGTSDATMTFTGTLANINTALNGLTFTPTANYHGSASVQIATNDQGNTGSGGAQGNSDTVSVTVNSVNDAPSGTNKTITTGEDFNYTFTGSDFGFSDTDANSFNSVKITTLPGAGTLTNNNVAVSAGDFVSLSDIGAGKLKFVPPANANGTPYTTFTFQVKDDGGTANGGVDLDPSAKTMTVNLTAINDAPVNTVPGSQTTAKNVSLVFSTTNNNAISIADVDAGSALLQVTLGASNGTLTLSGLTGLSFTTGDGTSDATMTFTGTLANINNALNGLTFTPTTNYTGAATVYIMTNDQGNTGSGGALSDSDSVTVTITV